MLEKTSEEKLDFLIKEVEKIKGYLENDTSTNTQGLVESHREIKRKVYALEEREKIRLGKQSVWTLIAGAVGGFVIWLIQAFINKQI